LFIPGAQVRTAASQYRAIIKVLFDGNTVTVSFGSVASAWVPATLRPATGGPPDKLYPLRRTDPFSKSFEFSEDRLLLMAQVTVHVKPRFGDLKLRWEGALTDPNLVIDCINAHRSEWTGPSLWMKLQGPDLNHLNFFLSQGFTMHRIKRDTILVLNLWLKSGVKNLPPAPFCYVGCAALVVNDENKVLAVRENYAKGPGPWKLPGGLFDPTKDKKIGDAAIRECLEETGIRAEFQFIALERFTVNSSMFHRQDFYIICRLKPLATAIQFDPVEIADCQWIDQELLLAATHATAKTFLGIALKVTEGITEQELRGCTIYHPAVKALNSENSRFMVGHVTKPESARLAIFVTNKVR
jgi:8-oxo-dGTP pyrophosphatase MutT (NUDIX family)